MEIYFGLLFWSLLSGFLCFGSGKKDNKYKRKLYIVLNFFPMLMIGGMRAVTVGTDTMMYGIIFDNISNESFELNFFRNNGEEFGYVLLNHLVAAFTNDSQIFIFIANFIVISGFAWFFYKNSSNLWLSTFLFIGFSFYCETLNAMRQAVAAMLVCNAYYYLKHDSNMMYVLMVLIAASFHFSAIVFFPFVFLFPLNKKKLYLTLGISIILMTFLLMGALHSISDYLPVKYSFYLISEQYGVSRQFDFGLFKVILYSVFIGICIYFIKARKFDVAERKDAYYLCVFVYCACLATLAQYNMVIFYRFIYYFALFLCLLIPLIAQKMGKWKNCFSVFLVVYIVLYFAQFLSKNPDFQYKFYW